MQNGIITGIGETVLDILFKNDQPITAVPGGSTFNSIISLGRAGMPCRMVTEVGDDHVGDITCQYMQTNGVSDEYVVRHNGIKSHISLAFLDEQNDAHYQFYKDHASVRLDGPMPKFGKADMVLFGSFFAINPAIRTEVKQMLDGAHEAGAFIYYDVNFRKPHLQDLPMVAENIRENMQLSSVVRGSVDDFSLLYGLKDAAAIYEKVSESCSYFICTNGAEQIDVFTPSHHLIFAVRQIETVSTVGAGDNFNAGFMYALSKKDCRDLSLLTEKEWQELVASGQMFAQDVCAQSGNSISPHLTKTLR